MRMNFYFYSDLARIVGDGGSYSFVDFWSVVGRVFLRSLYSRELGRFGFCSY